MNRKEHSNYFKDSNGDLFRDNYLMTGILFELETKGVGDALSLSVLILHLAMGFALSVVVSIVVDLVLICILPGSLVFNV